MIIYQATKEHFLNDILSNNIDNIINESYLKATGRGVSASEKTSWKEVEQKNQWNYIKNSEVTFFAWYQA